MIRMSIHFHSQSTVLLKSHEHPAGTTESLPYPSNSNSSIISFALVVSFIWAVFLLLCCFFSCFFWFAFVGQQLCILGNDVIKYAPRVLHYLWSYHCFKLWFFITATAATRIKLILGQLNSTLNELTQNKSKPPRRNWRKWNSSFLSLHGTNLIIRVDCHNEIHHLSEQNRLLTKKG